ncbi:MAG: hypothetical protein KAH22_10170 [Thiotrichaceae bacterium]|nr:hypothetical protein [Thiotrichaceae bacterium]
MTANKRTLISSALILASTLLLVAIYYSPVWWVALTAPNYPEEAFPDGVRIDFHMNGVFNGCKKINKAELAESEALDCVHEMDTINHYVGMYPIAAGGVIERAFSPFLVGLLSVMLLGFFCRKPKIRLLIMSAGFGMIAVWMSMTWYGKAGLDYHNAGYIFALVTSMDQDTNKEAVASVGNSGAVSLAKLKASLSGKEFVESDVELVANKKPEETSQKQNNIYLLKSIFDIDQAKKPKEAREEWQGNGSQMMAWHYQKNLGRYFNNPAEITPMVKTMSLVSHIVFWGILGAMLLMLFGVWKKIILLNWILILVPMALPLFFIIEYSGWLYWYGHTLNDMGAFTVKPFMPTVFGQGKVAQFTTHSYPAIGFFMMMAMAIMLALAALMRRKQGEV